MIGDYRPRSRHELLAIYQLVDRRLDLAFAQISTDLRVYLTELVGLSVVVLHQTLAKLDHAATQDLFRALAEADGPALSAGYGLENPNIESAIIRLNEAALQRGRS